MTARVAELKKETADVRSVVISPTNGSKLPAFSPGSHVDVYMRQGLVRPYSLCGHIEDTNHYRIAVKRDPHSRGGSRFMHEELAVGDLLTIGLPRNNFGLRESSEHTLLLAGGIGITPIFTMAERLKALGRNFELHYFSRSPDRAPFFGYLSTARYVHHVHFHFTHGSGAGRACLAELLSSPPADCHVYLCGPMGFMDLAQRLAAGRWSPAAIHLERFADGPNSFEEAQPGFQVHLRRSGSTYFVPEDTSIMDALEQNGVDVPYSCRQGLCGTCLTGVLEGEPDHRDTFLSKREKAANDKMCLCVSRAKSNLLVLDI